MSTATSEMSSTLSTRYKLLLLLLLLLLPPPPPPRYLVFCLFHDAAAFSAITPTAPATHDDPRTRARSNTPRN
jgi:hypothetical protein